MRGGSGSRIGRARSAADVAAAVELCREYARGLGVDLSFQGFEAEMAAMPGAYAPPRGELLLARGPDGEAIGCAALRPVAPEGCCEMKRLYVRPSARGSGAGARLVAAALREASLRGFREMRLDTLPSMAGALSLYRKAGFAEIAPYYDTPLAGTVFLARALP